MPRKYNKHKNSWSSNQNALLMNDVNMICMVNNDLNILMTLSL